MEYDQNLLACWERRQAAGREGTQAAEDSAEFFGDLDKEQAAVVAAYTYHFFLGLITQDEFFQAVNSATGCDWTAFTTYYRWALEQHRRAR